MATLEKRGNYWRVKVRRRGFPDQTRTFDTKSAAASWAREIESEIDRGTFLDRTESERNTLGDMIERYLKEVTPTKKGAGPEDSRLRAFLRRPISKYKMSALSSAMFAQYRDERLQTVTAGTVNKELNHVSHVIETARREWGVVLASNPIQLVRRPPAPKSRDRRLEGDEHERLLSACADARNPYLASVVTLAVETAMRQSEIVSLRWKHVDLKKRVAYLPDTKNGDSRGVPLSTAAVDVLTALQRSERDDGVFPGLTAEAVKRAFMRACARANIEGLHFHDLRHEATSRLFERGLDAMSVATITGHKTLQMLKRYTHLKAEDLANKLR